MITKLVLLDLKRSIDTLELGKDRQTDIHHETEGNVIRQISRKETKLYRLRFFLFVMSFFPRDVHRFVD